MGLPRLSPPRVTQSATQSISVGSGTLGNPNNCCEADVFPVERCRLGHPNVTATVPEDIKADLLLRIKSFMQAC